MPSHFDQRHVRLNAHENMNVARKTQHKIGNSQETKLRHW